MRGHKQERILRVLLADKEASSKSEIARKAQCTRPWVILFLRKLEKMKLVKGTRVLDAKKLIKYWQGVHKKPDNYRSYMIKEPLKLLRGTRLEYALTTYQAENIVQHHLFPSRIDVYINEEDLSKWHELMTKNGLYGKGNVRVMITDNHVMYKKRKLEGLYAVCLPQLIIDLSAEGGVCEEAAQLLMNGL
ncbi:MAG: hypothetical protein V1729_04770 [Candidatus Woesearchaeota archaeon]